MKIKWFSMFMVFVMATLACSTLSVPTATATATVEPTATKTEVPTVVPDPTKTYTPTPKVNQCEDLENKAFVYNDNLILIDFVELDKKAMSHFPGDGKIISERLAEDTEKIREIYNQIADLEAPLYFKTYHDLEVEFLKNYVTALDAAVKGDRGRTFTYLDETQRVVDLLAIEIERLNTECPEPNTSQIG